MNPTQVSRSEEAVYALIAAVQSVEGDADAAESLESKMHRRIRMSIGVSDDCRIMAELLLSLGQHLLDDWRAATV